MREWALYPVGVDGAVTMSATTSTAHDDQGESREEQMVREVAAKFIQSNSMSINTQANKVAFRSNNKKSYGRAAGGAAWVERGLPHRQALSRSWWPNNYSRLG
jgi:hypothetical protein